MLLTREQLVIDLCTFPLLQLYLCMHIIFVLRLIPCCALRSLKYKRLHNLNWQSPFLIQQSLTTSTLLFNIKVRYPSLFKLIYIFTHSPHSPHLSSRLRDRWTLVSWGGSPIRDSAPYQTWTLPLLGQRGRRARLRLVFHRSPEGKEDHAPSVGTH